MKTDRTVSPDPAGAGLIRAWSRFWFTPADPRGLHWLRVLSGLLFTFWLLSFAGHQRGFFAFDGWFDRQAFRQANQLPEGPPAPISWSILYLVGDGQVTLDTVIFGTIAIQSHVLLETIYWSSIGILVLYTIGVATRITAVLAWVIVALFIGSPAIDYDADYLLAILAFYLMVAHVLLGQWSRPLTITQRLLGSNDGLVWRLFRRDSQVEPAPSHAARFGLRLLQIHFAIIMVVSGLHKLQIADWLAGVAFWYPMYPPFETTQEIIQAKAAGARSYLAFLSLAQYVALAWQLSFPFFAWRGGRWRIVLLGGAAIGWIGSALVLRLPLFGPIIAIACLSYLTPAEWQTLFARLRRRTEVINTDRVLSSARKEQLTARM